MVLFVLEYLIRYLYNLLHKKRNSLSEDVHGKMIDQMMIPIHAIVPNEELWSHVHAIKAVHLFCKKHLHEEKQQNSRHDLVHDCLEDVLEDPLDSQSDVLEDHYINLYAPDLITDSAKREAECEDDDDGEEEETRDETSLLIDQTNNGVKQLMNVVSPSSRVVGAHKAFNDAVNASTIQRRTALSSTYNKAKNLGGYSFYEY